MGLLVPVHCGQDSGGSPELGGLSNYLCRLTSAASFCYDFCGVEASYNILLSFDVPLAHWHLQGDAEVNGAA